MLELILAYPVLSICIAVCFACFILITAIFISSSDSGDAADDWSKQDSADYAESITPTEQERYG